MILISEDKRRALKGRYSQLLHLHQEVEDAQPPERNFKRDKLLGRSKGLKRRISELVEDPTIWDDVICKGAAAELWVQNLGLKAEVRIFGPWHIAVLSREEGIVARGRACNTAAFAIVSAYLKYTQDLIKREIVDSEKAEDTEST